MSRNMIISFVTLSYLQFHIKGMIKASILFAVLAVTDKGRR